MINGSYLKRLRLDNNCTLTRLSAETGYTPSFLSQIERGLKEPSLATLRKLADYFGVPLVSFFRQCDSLDREIYQETAPIQVVQKNMRKPLHFPGVQASLETLTLPNLRPDGRPAVAGAVCTLASAKWCADNSMVHPLDLCLYVHKGGIVFQSKEVTLYLEEGDCVYVKADTTFNFQNIGDEDCTLLVFSG